HAIILKPSMATEWFHSAILISGTAVMNGLNINVNQNAKNVRVLAFYEPFAQAQFQNLKQILAKIRLPWKDLEAPARRDVLQLASLTKRAQRPGPVPAAVLHDLAAVLKRIKVNELKKRLGAIQETLCQIEAARILSERAATYSRAK